MAVGPNKERQVDPSAFRKEIQTFIGAEETWERDLRKRIAKRVRAAHRYTIESEIESGFRWQKSVESKDRRDNLISLKRRIVSSNATTGNFSKDACFVIFERFDENIEAEISRLNNRLQKNLSEEQNPLVARIHFFNAETRTFQIGELAEPGLVILPDFEYKQVEEAEFFKLQVNTKNGHMSYEKTAPYHSETGLNLSHYQETFRFPESSEQVVRNKGHSDLLLVGREDISEFIKTYPEHSEKVLKMYIDYRRATDEEIVNALEMSKASFAASHVSRFFDAFKEIDDLPEDFKQKLEKQDLEGVKHEIKVDLWGKYINLWERGRAVIDLGAYIEDEQVVFVNDVGAELGFLEEELGKLSIDFDVLN